MLVIRLYVLTVYSSPSEVVPMSCIVFIANCLQFTLCVHLLHTIAQLQKKRERVKLHAVFILLARQRTLLLLEPHAISNVSSVCNCLLLCDDRRRTGNHPEVALSRRM